MRGFSLLAVLALLLATHPARAQVRPFESGSLAKIRAQREGRPFILSFWSVDCTHCPKELKALGAQKRHPKLDIVLVSTDTPAEADALAGFAARQGLATAEQWVFAGPQPQRLRFEVDPRWWGELPRTYFHDAAHGVEAVSGVVPVAQLKRWARANGQH